MIRKLQWIRLIIAIMALFFLIYMSAVGNEILLPYVDGIIVLCISIFTMLLSAEMRIKKSNDLLTYFLFFFSLAMFYITIRTIF